jgi:hypothetical protein
MNEDWNPEWNYTTGIRMVFDTVTRLIEDHGTLTAEETSWFMGAIEMWLANHEMPPLKEGQPRPVDGVREAKKGWLKW